MPSNKVGGGGHYATACPQGIHCLELLAGAFAVKTFVKGKVQMRVRLLMDNLTAAHYINKMGGTKSPVLACLALDLWEWCLYHHILIEARYLPGVLNIRADQGSRVFLDQMICGAKSGLGSFRGRPVFLSALNSTSTVLQLETR